MPSVRKATEKDIPKILELLVQVDMVHHLGRPDIFKGPATKYGAEELKVILQDDKTPVFVCVPPEDEELPEGSPKHPVLGHAFCIRQKIGNAVLAEIMTLYVDDICVDENARGQGVGRRLFEHVEKYARDEGFYNITLNVWAFNEGAKAFYDSCGMQVQKYGMEKVL